MKVELVPIIAGYACSECGTTYTVTEYVKYYSKYPLNCKMCGAVFGKEKPETINQLSFFGDDTDETT